MDDQLKINIAYITVVHKLHDHRFLYKQCCGLAEQNCNVDYYVQADKVEVIYGVNIKPLKPPRNRIMRFFYSFKLLPRIIKGKYNIINVLDPELLPLGILLKILTKTVVIFDAHEDYMSFMALKHYLNWFLKRFFSFAIKQLLYLSSITFDGFVFADEKTAEQFKKLPPGRKGFFYNFPLRSMFPERQQKWSDRKHDIVFLGTMSRTSGTFVTLEAIKIVRQAYPSLRCLFIGQPESQIKQQVDVYIRENNLDKCIQFTGRLPHAKVPNLLQQCKVGLIGLLDMPKFHKNIATKMFEYMASGIPVVSSDLPPERKYIIPGKCGYLVPPEDPIAMAKAIGKILSNTELGNEMSSFCYQYMIDKNYYAENEIKKLVEFYTYLLNHPRGLLCAN